MRFRLPIGVSTVIVSALFFTGAPMQLPELAPAAGHLHLQGHTAVTVVKASSVRQMQLVDVGKAWVSTGTRLLWSNDNGEYWKDISPSHPRGVTLIGASFLNATTGWAVYAGDAEEEGTSAVANGSGPVRNYALLVASTSDGGETWNMGQLPAWKGDRGLEDSGHIAFADKMHGWPGIEIEGNTMMASSALLYTSDAPGAGRQVEAMAKSTISWLLPLQRFGSYVPMKASQSYW